MDAFQQTVQKSFQHFNLGEHFLEKYFPLFFYPAFSLS